LPRETGEFLVNIPGEGLLDELEYCGFVSGWDADRFDRQKLAPALGSRLQTPIIEECLINIECRLAHTLSLGSHHLSIGEVLAMQLSDEVLDDRGRVDNGRLKPVLFTGDEYWGLGGFLGRLGGRRR
jgi:flavin reductase (DIM6/NTAB) family NADH-FMN oxidoreductase RutF